MMTNEQKVRENRIRRIANRRGFKLTKSRLRDPKAIGYGLYSLTTDDDGLSELTLNEIEDILK